MPVQPTSVVVEHNTKLRRTLRGQQEAVFEASYLSPLSRRLLMRLTGFTPLDQLMAADESLAALEAAAGELLAAGLAECTDDHPPMGAWSGGQAMSMATGAPAA